MLSLFCLIIRKIISVLLCPVVLRSVLFRSALFRSALFSFVLGCSAIFAEIFNFSAFLFLIYHTYFTKQRKE